MSSSGRCEAQDTGARPHLSRRGICDFVLAVSGFVYILLTLWLALDAPLLSALFLLLALHELASRTSGAAAGNGRKGT